MYDLSLVTDALRQILVDAIGTSTVWGGGPPPFQVGVTAQNPDQSPTTADTDLNLFLFHVNEDPYQKNAFWQSAGQQGPAQPVAYQPAAFDLYYLMSARSQTGYVNEQQVLGVAMKALHDNAVVRLSTPIPFGTQRSEITVTMEHPTWDELCRLWQGIGAPMRATAEYRVGVVFLTPDQPRTTAPEVKSFAVVADPATAADPSMPQLIGTSRSVRYAGPTGTRSFELTPASSAPAPPGSGQDVVLRGVGIAATDTVHLVAVDATGTETEVDVTADWVVPLTPPYTATPVGGVAVVLRPPAAAGAAPAGCPPPGGYLLRLGRPSVPGWRSNPVPLALAPWVDPAGGPVVAPDGAGVFTVSVRGLPGSGARLRLGTVTLAPHTGGGGPGAGEWALTGTTVTFMAPGALAAGSYELGVRAADIDADPAIWAAVP